jgi:hypothetical protein
MRKLRVAQYGFCHEHAAGKMLSLRNFRQLFRLVRGKTAPDATLYDHDLAVHEVVLAAAGIGTGGLR